MPSAPVRPRLSAVHPLRIAVLVKQIPKVEAMVLGDDGRLVRDGLPLEMNAYCRRAVAIGAELAAVTGGTVTVLTLGPPSAEDALREAIAWIEDRGVAAQGVLVSDPAFAGSDTLATARARLQADGTASGRAVIDTLDAMARRVERLLQLSRAEAGIGRSGGPTDLRRVLGLLIGEAERRFQQPVAFDDDAAGSPVLPVDPDALAILLTNLLENAIQHGAGNVRVALGPDLRLAICNDVAEGAEFHPGRFRKGNASGGSGLGLAIAQMIAKDLGVALNWSIRGGRATVALDLSGAAAGR